jgi:hypothetical protein
MRIKKSVQKIETKTTKSVSYPFEQSTYPLFCFKYLSDASIKKCKNPKLLFDFSMRLKKISELGWAEIRKSNRHSFGMEKIPISKIKHKLPIIVSPEAKELDVFRATGNNLPFIGKQDGNIFRIFFIETKFGDIYDHT